MDFDDLDLEWLTETVRSHIEAVKQVEALPLEQRQTMTAQLERGRVVLGSAAFAEFVVTLNELGGDMARYRELRGALPPHDLAALEAELATRISKLRGEVSSFKLLLGHG